jgi:hypothetical protein
MRRARLRWVLGFLVAVGTLMGRDATGQPVVDRSALGVLGHDAGRSAPLQEHLGEHLGAPFAEPIPLAIPAWLLEPEVIVGGLVGTGIGGGLGYLLWRRGPGGHASTNFWEVGPLVVVPLALAGGAIGVAIGALRASGRRSTRSGFTSKEGA